MLRRKAEKGIGIALSLIALVLYAKMVHDVQTAHGVGLYLSILCGREDRRWFDLGADLVRIAVFASLLLVPCILSKRRDAGAVFRMLSLWIGFAPFVSGAKMVHILFDRQIWLTGGMSLSERFWEGCAQIFVVFRSWAPILCLLFFGRELIGGGTVRKALGAFLTVQVLLIPAMFLFPACGEIWKLGFMYLLLLECFVVCGELSGSNERWDRYQFWLFLLFWVRGIYRLTELLKGN